MKNLKIKAKLVISFGSIVVLATLVVLFLIGAMHHIASLTGQLYEGPYHNVNDVWVLRRNLIDVQRVINQNMAQRDLIVTEDGYAAFKDVVEKDVNEIKNAVSALEQEIQYEDNKQRLLEIKKVVDEGEQVRAQLMELLEKKRIDEAYDLNFNTYLPIVNEINTKSVDLFNSLSEDAQEFVDTADRISFQAFLIGTILLIGGITYSVVMMLKITGMVAGPIQQITRAAGEMYKGDMSAGSMITYESRDEIGILADCMRGTMANLQSYVQEISDVLKRISGGDLTVPGDHITDFLGDFASIKESLVYILKRFNTTLNEINQTASDVAGSSSQIASAAQDMASGATEQAGTLETLVSSISNISGQVTENAANAKKASSQSHEAGSQAEICKGQMDKMMVAMKEINEASDEIGKIIKTIEDIAFQTNILALNAAVEAARAGSAGKGFAVVADEVRNLASKSAEASKDTAVLIEKCVGAVDNGTVFARETSEALLSVVQKVEAVNALIGNIADQNEKQALAVSDVSQGVEQVYGVVHNNSATAQESAATSEELSNEAARLDELVRRFKLFQG